MEDAADYETGARPKVYDSVANREAFQSYVSMLAIGMFVLGLIGIIFFNKNLLLTMLSIELTYLAAVSNFVMCGV